MEQKEFDLLVEKVGKEAAVKIAAEFKNYENKAKEIADEAIKGHIKKETFDSFQQTTESAINAIKEIAEKQGTTITELLNKVETGGHGGKSIAKVFEENKDELLKIYQQGSGAKTFMITVGKNGELVMRPYDTTTKAPHATIDGVGGGTSAISQSIDAATLLRLGAAAPLISQYRNSPWVFDLCNLINAGYEQPFALWYEEQAGSGGSNTVAEGATKPGQNFVYALKSATYKKEAVLIGFTEEFSLDFSRLQSDIMGKGRVDMVNNINTKVLTRIISAATAYNSGDDFKGGVAVANANDYDAIAAMAAQVDNSTFGGFMANTAVMSTFKKYRMGVEKSTQGEYLNRPGVLDGLTFVGNPAMTADQALVGDFKQYNIILRGGLIVRVGYNGTDFAENKFSVVMEQFYFDYISDIRKKAIVKGPDFATVKAAIS
jgi:hypothetical protein